MSPVEFAMPSRMHSVTGLSALSRLLLWSGVAAIVLLSLAPGSERPHTGFSGKFEHFVAYAVVGGLAVLAYGGQRGRILFVWCAMTAASALLELGQMYVPGRNAGVLDLLASSSGALAGLLFALLVCLALRPALRRSPSRARV